jgi:hypothetical protein
MSKIHIHSDRQLATLLGLGAAGIGGGALLIKNHAPKMTASFKASRASRLHSPHELHPRLQGYIVGGGVGVAAASVTAAGNAAAGIGKYRTNAVGGRGPDPMASIQANLNQQAQIKNASAQEEENNNMQYEVSNTDWLNSIWLNKSANEFTDMIRDKRLERINDKSKDKKHDNKEEKGHEKKESKKEEVREEKKEEKKASSPFSEALAAMRQGKQASHPGVTFTAHNPAQMALVAGAVLPAAYALGTGMNLIGGRLSTNLSHTLPDNSVARNHPYLTSLTGQLGGSLLGPAAPLVSIPMNIAAEAGAMELGEEAAAGKVIDGPLSNYSHTHPILGPMMSSLIPGAHSPNSAIAAHRIAADAQRERNFTWRHPVASTFLHGLIPGAGTAYAIAAAKIQDMKEKAASSASSKAAVKGTTKKAFNKGGHYLKPHLAAALLALPASYGAYRMAQDYLDQ